MKRVICAVGMCAVIVLNSSAVEFDLRDTTAAAEIESGTVTRAGITATLSALVDGGSGVLNQTTSGFGINADGSGDATSAIDGDNGAESVSMVFSFDVVLNSISVSGFSTSDAGALTISSFSPVPIGASGTFGFSENNVVMAGESVVLAFVSGNGFSFDGFDVELYESPPAGEDKGNSVPDGGKTLFLLLGGMCVVSLAHFHKSLP